NSKAPDANAHQPPKIMPYMAAAALIMMGVYFLPNYLFLEVWTANNAAYLLSLIGTDAQVMITGGAAFLDGIHIVRECTGIQVIAVFMGLLIPLPNAGWKRKLLALSIVSAILYAANAARIALEFSLVYYGMLPWSLAHYPMSLLLGILGMLLLVVITDKVLPEFGDFLLSAFRSRSQ
ncbi:MAG TPA: archaeosortase/exosortase family protein, partial [Candidatus Methanomethylicus sp.]|nr:archaeosortase/exosortase family protein [Candidatus Methanomethylicus sp.]